MSKQTLTRIEIADSLNKELGISLSESNYSLRNTTQQCTKPR